MTIGNEEQNSQLDRARSLSPTQARTESRAPRYLVLGSNGNLGGYMREDILLCDLAMNKRDGDPALAVYEINDGLRTVYQPITVEEIHKRYQETNEARSD